MRGNVAVRPGGHTSCLVGTSHRPTHRCQALLISAETAIGGAAEPTTVVGSPRTILRVRGRSDRGSDEQNAKQKKRSFHDHSFRSTLGRATSNRQLSSRLD